MNIFRTASMTSIIIFYLGLSHVARGQSSEPPALAMMTRLPPMNCDELLSVEPKAYQKALVLFDTANNLVNDFLFDEAVHKYREALQYWRHPRIYYNLSRAQSAMERPLDAYRSIEQALQCGPEPLDDDPKHAQENYALAEKLRKKFLEELAILHLVPKERGVDLDMAGESFHDLQDTHVQLAVPKSTTVVAQKRNHVTQSITIHPKKGEQVYLDVSSEHDIPTWIPWAVMGVGAAIGAVGGVYYGKSWIDRGALDAQINQTCVPNGCEELDARFLEPWNSIKSESALGIGGMALGATVILGGFGLFLWNRTPVLQITPRPPDVAVQVNKDGAMISGQVKF